MANQIAIQTLPDSLLTYRQYHAKLQNSPKGALINFLLALHLYRLNFTEGLAALSLAVHPSQLIKGTEGFEGWQINRNAQTLIATQLRISLEIPNAYLQGCQPDNHYQVPAPPFCYQFVPTRFSGDAKTGYYRVTINCNGLAADLTALCRIDKNHTWRIDDWSALLVPVKQAARV